MNRHNTGVLALARRGLPIAIADYILRTLVPRAERIDAWIRWLVIAYAAEQEWLRGILPDYAYNLEYLPGVLGEVWTNSLAGPDL